MPESRRSPAKRTVGVVAAVVVLAGLYALWGLYKLQEHSRSAEPLWLLADIAQAEDAYRRDSKTGRYLSISGGPEDGPIHSFFPAAHPRGEFAAWDPPGCADSSVKVPCKAFGALSVKVNAGAVLYRYGGGAAVGFEQCRALARANGASDPPILPDGEPCFVLVAIDGEGGAYERLVVSSWARQARSIVKSGAGP